MPLPKSFTTVTTFSKLLAMFLFILFPLVGFYAGMKYQEKLTPQSAINISISPTPTVMQKIPKRTMCICPDGSSVVRTGPHCEFAACPK